MLAGTPGSTKAARSRPLGRACSAEQRDDRVDDVGGSTAMRSSVQLARLDLREIQDVVDDGEQALPGLGDHLGVAALARRQVAARPAVPPSPACRSWACGSRGSWWPGSRIWPRWRASASSLASRQVLRALRRRPARAGRGAPRSGGRAPRPPAPHGKEGRSPSWRSRWRR